MLLDSKSKFDFGSPGRQTRTLSPDTFYNWTSNHLYRTSYNDMGIVKSPVSKKNHVLPKYQGYIPGKIANNEFGASITGVSRRVFSPEKLDTPSLYASTGHNWNTDLRKDPTLPAWSHKYGKQTILRPHPNVDEPKWSTVFRQSFGKPQEKLKPVTRQAASMKDLMFDNTMRNSFRPITQTASGFQNNRQLFDGQTWVPDKILHTDMVRTEYRNKFNQPKPFHKTALMASTGKLPKVTLVYDIE